MPNTQNAVFPAKLTPGLGVGGGSGPSITSGLLQETGFPNFFELENGTGVILLES